MVRLTPAMWIAIGIVSLLTLARFSEAFLVLRADSGIPQQWVPLCLVGLHAMHGRALTPHDGDTVREIVPVDERDRPARASERASGTGVGFARSGHSPDGGSPKARGIELKE